jgi:hypothetical protein
MVWTNTNSPQSTREATAANASWVAGSLIYGAWTTYGPGGTIDQHEQMEQEVEDLQRENCESAAENGIELPGC